MNRVSRHLMQLCSLVHVQIDQHVCQLSSGQMSPVLVWLQRQEGCGVAGWSWATIHRADEEALVEAGDLAQS